MISIETGSRFTLDKLKDLEGTDNPKYVFSHIYSPHPPFVFNEEGNPIHPQRSFNKFDADGYPSIKAARSS